MRVVVAGGALSGTAAALALARAGHDVILVERDAHAVPASPADVWDGWQRPGVPHFRLPHQFLALGRAILLEHFHDVFDDLLQAGAVDLDLTAAAPAGMQRTPDLRALAVRRPFIEWAFRRAIDRDRRVTVLPGVRVSSLLPSDRPGRAGGVRTEDGRSIEGDLVIDATGRSSRLASWLVDIGADPMREEVSPCGLVYYARYYRFRSGGTLPATMHPLGPRADLGYMAYGTFNGDSGTWSIVLMVPSGSREWHALRDEPAFTAALRALPAVAPLVADDVSLPISPVLGMGELRNVRRSLIHDGRPVALGVLAIGDVLANTNPVYAWGLSLGLANAVELARVVNDHPTDFEAIAVAFDDAAAPRASACFRWSRETDDSRKRAWSGETIDATSADGDLPLFLSSTLLGAARYDAEIYMRVHRRAQLLDDLDELPRDRALLDRAARIVAERRKSAAAPRPGPELEEMRSIVSRAKATAAGP